MSALYLLIPLSLMVAGAFLVAFIWAVRSGQYEDTDTPAMRVLTDDVSMPRRPTLSTNSKPDQTNERRDLQV